MAADGGRSWAANGLGVAAYGSEQATVPGSSGSPAPNGRKAPCQPLLDSTPGDWGREHRAGDLVIGIGNSLRGDDGVGWWLAQRAERWLPPDRVRAVRQLTPELAAELAAATRVLFLDAWLPPGDSGWLSRPEADVARNRPAGAEVPGNAPIPAAAGSATVPAPVRSAGWSAPAASEPAAPVLRRLRESGPEAEGATGPLTAFSHQLNPGTLMRMTQLLLGQRPEAWQLLVPAFELDHGEGLSARQRALLPRAETLLRRWIQGEVATGLRRHA
ncbi:MAG: hypothetical protein ACK5N0_03300 [Synechococcaceae cyanobacterium]